MKSFIYYITVILLVNAVSCTPKHNSNIEKKIMGKWYNKELKFPANMLLLNSDLVKPENKFDVHNPDSKFYVLRYFSAECDKCVTSLITAKDFIEKRRQDFPNLKYVFIASGASDVFVKEAIEKAKFNFPVYFERGYLKFKVENEIPLDHEELYDVMLINNKNRLILFGSIYDNPKAQDLYKAIINNQ